MIVYVVFGGMKGTTWVQIVKAVMLMPGALRHDDLVLAEFSFNLSALLGAAADKSGKGESFLQPGLRYGMEIAGRHRDPDHKLDFISLALALVLGTAGLPHILIRFYTVPDSKAARKSVRLGDRPHRHLLPDDAGAGLRRGGAGRPARRSSPQDPAGNTAAPQLAEALGGQYLGGTPAARAARGDRRGRVRHHPRGGRRADPGVVVVAGARPVRERDQARARPPSSRRSGRPDRRVRASARCRSCWRFRRNLNVAFLVAIAFAIAASANLPVILFSLFWKRFNTRGATWGIYGGLISAVGWSCS